MENNKLAEHILDWMRGEVLNYFSRAARERLQESTWVSGHLTDNDIRMIESCGHQIQVSAESGETFYKVNFYKKFPKITTHDKEQNVYHH